jgi:hypothetical protein
MSFNHSYFMGFIDAAWIDGPIRMQQITIPQEVGKKPSIVGVNSYSSPIHKMDLASLLIACDYLDEELTKFDSETQHVRDFINFGLFLQNQPENHSWGLWYTKTKQFMSKYRPKSSFVRYGSAGGPSADPDTDVQLTLYLKPVRFGSITLLFELYNIICPLWWTETKNVINLKRQTPTCDFDLLKRYMTERMMEDDI